MKQIFVNLKRFDVPRNLGGICQMDEPKRWAEWVMDEMIRYGLGERSDIKLAVFMPESLIITAVERLNSYPKEKTMSISMGCQGVYREDVKPGGNFGAFTTNRPAAAAKAIGCSWSIIGHSEERKDKLDIIRRYDPMCDSDERRRMEASAVVSGIINEELRCALEAGLNALVCIGETSEEKGDGSFEEQKPHIMSVLKKQIEQSLFNLSPKQLLHNVVIGYEPVWAIGPGKTPPGPEYIAFVSRYIKDVIKEAFGIDIPVVYGGGLKEDNAADIATVKSIDGGLVALTRFTGQVAFEPSGLKAIIDKYIGL